MKNPNAIPLSLSLPLRVEPFTAREFRPYFEGLSAEGDARRSLAATLGVREDDYLAILAACGKDCIGDVLVWEEHNPLAPSSAFGYEHIPQDELHTIVR